MLHAEDVEPPVDDALPVLADVTFLEPARPLLPVATQAIAVAATGILAGVATVAVVRRRRVRKATRRRRKQARRTVDLLQVVGSRSFLVDVHLLARD